MQKVLDDLKERELTVSGFIAQDSDGKFIFISYGENGLVNFMSKKANNISINERLEGRMIRPLVDLNNKETE